MEHVGMEEASQRLGVTVATIRRKLHSGELQGFQEPTSQGFKWQVEVPESGTPEAYSEGGVKTGKKKVVGSNGSVPDGVDAGGELGALRETVAILSDELEARRREVQELHVLLQHAQAALPAPKESRSWWRFWERPGRA